MGPLQLAVASCAVVLTAAGCAPTGAPTADAESATATVARVSDGDTLRLTNGSKVRLLQIDAPERDADCFGREATRALTDLSPKGTTVILEADPSLDDEDAYGRLLRYVIVNGRNVNLELVAGGAAAPYFFRKERGRYAAELLTSAKRARSERRGFWGACPGAELNPGIGSVTGPSR